MLKGPCEIWTNYIGQNGYGQLHRGGRVQNAHAYFYEKKYGIVPLGHVLDHLCGNRACINPDHMEVVLQAVNVRRGRRAKLTQEQADIIKSEYRLRDNVFELAERFGISPNQVRYVASGHSWKPLSECKLTEMRKNKHAN